MINGWYGAIYDPTADEYYDCIHNELYNHKTKVTKQWAEGCSVWGVNNYWYVWEHEDPKRLTGSYSIFHSNLSLFEYYDAKYEMRIGTDGTVVYKDGSIFSP